MNIETLPILDLDHPGAQDAEYRERRRVIVQNALDFHAHGGGDIPLVVYSEDEHETWAIINSVISVLHQKWACQEYLRGRELIQIDMLRIPQLCDLDLVLRRVGFRLEPIHGLVLPRQFLFKIAQKAMLCTQYIRHSSNPFFTPEPDIVHEVLGHVPMFMSEEVVMLQTLIGQGADHATEEQLTCLNRLYWYSIEYGLIREDGEIKAFGAGLLGGIKDLTNAMTGERVIRPFVISDVILTDYNYSFEQPHFFVIESLPSLIADLKEWLAKEGLM